jgi:hypothetical protein
LQIGNLQCSHFNPAFDVQKAFKLDACESVALEAMNDEQSSGEIWRPRMKDGMQLVPLLRLVFRSGAATHS